MGESGSASPDRPNLYEILEVSPGASAAVIYAAYRALARQYHPDVRDTAKAAQLMADLNAAHWVLSDPKRRADYDAERARFAQARMAVRQTHAQRRLHSSTRRVDRMRWRRGLLAASQARVAPLVVAAIVAVFVVFLIVFGVDHGGPAGPPWWWSDEIGSPAQTDGPPRSKPRPASPTRPTPLGGDRTVRTAPGQ